MKKQRKTKDEKKRRGGKALSIAFWTTIPCTFALGALCLITFLILFDKLLFQPQLWSLFAFGVIGAIAVFGGSSFRRGRIFIHEMKHALVVIFAGAKLKDFQVGATEGEVSYEIPEDQLHYMPIIGLAPYCFPLFSFPVLVGSAILEPNASELSTLLLGLAFGADLALAWSEIDPRQTDFREVAGGFLASALYIAGILFCWANVCLLWVLGGRAAFYYAFFLGMRMVRLFTERYIGIH